MQVFRVSLICLVFSLFTGCGGGGDSESAAPADPNAPVLASVGSMSVIQGGTAINFSLSATDPNNSILSYAMDAGVGPGMNPQTYGASFDIGTGTFTWDFNGSPLGDYSVKFTVSNAEGYSDSETVTITVQDGAAAQYANGETQYGAHCQSCHGPGGRFGSATQIQCIDSATYYSKVNGGSMSGYASSMSDQDKADVLYYLDNYDPTRC